ncbi:MAG: dTDP-4-dehydrorhamnose 3,5-epimerase [Candidatus Pacebacteria bacterium]|nr:dTDP-4-dehydrorhamnose 3,5-epimerase [Candidatus Paceibacterota bacterium]
MEFKEQSIKGVFTILPTYREDERGYFAEVFKAEFFAANISSLPLIQENIAFSREVGTLRGLHAQAAPFAQGKLLRVLRGVILDMVVDIRPDSPSLGQSLCLELSAASHIQLWLPPGLLHGYQVLEANSEISYRVTAPYAPQSEFGVIWNDPELNLPWHELAQRPILSAKDENLPSFRQLMDSIANRKIVPEK